eukprot:CAMPEP_0182897778 /NCGR_PEP_ID=MMETSP0034_2-20130328/27098_1 /TAXON_ID=156128 /ORGANISM="Nephroselmis pyriformis, Strain CCMP717" /LENGTH=160 /DNA_ID=CAMNT_0025031715 /DNA_START=92 /DNA_END=571 /DNA_ORIENTATION=+
MDEAVSGGGTMVPPLPGSTPPCARYMDVKTRVDVSAEEARIAYAVWAPGSSKTSTYRCDFPHILPGRSDPVGLVGIKYRAAKDTHSQGLCQKPGSRAAHSTPRQPRAGKGEKKEGPKASPEEWRGKGSSEGDSSTLAPLGSENNHLHEDVLVGGDAGDIG